MKRWQLLLLATMAALAIILFCVVASFSQSLFTEPDPTALAQMVAQTQAVDEASDNLTPNPTTTPTPIPTSTPTPVPTETETPVPTPTGTRVVLDTPTPTITPTPSVTPIPTNTPVPVSSGGGGGSTGSGGGGPVIIYATPTPSSRYPFGYVSEPLSWDTDNHFLVLLAKVTQGGVPVPGYRIVGTHSPTGFQWESEPTCAHWCKASGPEAVYDEDGKEIATFAIQEGNVAFEAPVYEAGTWTLMLVDSAGAQASEIFELVLPPTDKQWFFYNISR